MRWIRGVLVLTSLLTLVFLSATVSAFANSFVVFGENYQRTKAGPVTSTDTFNTLRPGTGYTLRLFNGDSSRSTRVTSAVVFLNGKQILGPSDFNANKTILERAVHLETTNTLAVELRGSPGTFFRIVIDGQDTVPPTIQGTASPTANLNDWNNTDVTISFVCSDSFSGIKSCSGPTTVSENGANQVVTGIVADNAGNTATATVKVNLDKVPPTLVATATPLPNVNGWNNSDVTVSFTCNDDLSGIADCPSPVSLTTSGASQPVNGAATDKAGNTANTSTLISLDKAPPTLSLDESASTVTTSSLTLSGTSTDALSGLMRVTCNGADGTISGDDFSCTVNLSEGPNTIQVRAFDCAGNSTTSSVTIHYTAFVPPPLGPSAVSWIKMVGVAASGNSLTKTNTTQAWNSGANSSQVLTDGYGFVEFTAIETNTARIAGLGSTDSSQSVDDVDFALQLRTDGSVAIWESGVSRGGFGSYAANDRFRVEVRYGVVRYLRNGALLFTSSAPVRYPLRVDTSLFSPGATLADVRVGNFVWTDDVGVRITGESLIKTGAAGWNAGAISTNTIESGDGYLEFTAIETDTARIAGLGNLVSGVAVSDIQFGIFLNSNGSVEIVEAGASRGIVGQYAQNDRFRVELRGGVVRYYRNNAPLYASLQIPSYPLRADSALDTPGATLTDVVLKPLGWFSAPGVYADGGSLIKTTADGWATASNSTFNLQFGDGYVEFTAIETNRRRGLGLKSGDPAGSLPQIDYFLSLNETGTVEVVELGTSRGLFGTYQNGDHFRIEIQNGIARYRKNGTLLFSSSVSASYPLHAEAALYSEGATLVDVDLGDLIWTNVVNARVVGHSLMKTSVTDVWDAGATSTRTTTSGYVDFTASEATTHRMAGLGIGDASVDFTDIDFGILLRSNASVAVYEAGSLRGDFGTYVTGDRFRVEVQAGTVRYFKNGILFYTSASHPLVPLRVDASLMSRNATLFNIIFR